MQLLDGRAEIYFHKPLTPPTSVLLLPHTPNKERNMNFVVTPFFNETSRFEPHRKGDKLTRSEMAFTDIDAETATDAAGKMFARMNADNRPNGKTERSLSVGDVLMIEWFDLDRLLVRQIRLAVDPVGFRPIV